ncbi:Retrotransposon-derived protein PEG10, partial [Smittium culicis]
MDQQQNQPQENTMSPEQDQNPFRAATPSLTNNIKLPDATKFDGTVSEYQFFLKNMSIFFYSSPELFAADKSKILYIGTHLLGTASDWFGTLVLQQAPCLQNYEAFITEFGNNFSDPSHSIKVRGLIRKCRQGPISVIAYATEFRSLARDSGFDNTALVDQFLRGLSPKIMQYLMVTDLPDSLEDTIKISVRVDNRIYTVDQINGDQILERSRNPFARQAHINQPISE